VNAAMLLTETNPGHRDLAAQKVQFGTLSSL
jgi:hypothetical protein